MVEVIQAEVAQVEGIVVLLDLEATAAMVRCMLSVDGWLEVMVKVGQAEALSAGG